MRPPSASPRALAPVSALARKPARAQRGAAAPGVSSRPSPPPAQGLLAPIALSVSLFGLYLLLKYTTFDLQARAGRRGLVRHAEGEAGRSAAVAHAHKSHLIAPPTHPPAVTRPQTGPDRIHWPLTSLDTSSPPTHPRPPDLPDSLLLAAHLPRRGRRRGAAARARGRRAWPAHVARGRARGAASGRGRRQRDQRGAAAERVPGRGPCCGPRHVPGDAPRRQLHAKQPGAARGAGRALATLPGLGTAACAPRPPRGALLLRMRLPHRCPLPRAPRSRASLRPSCCSCWACAPFARRRCL